ncbi:MAG: PRC-barrel domain containing protein [Rhodoferax sp.]|nr:PRC-barrel domain containing protein [Rhodoferax sp.]
MLRSMLDLKKYTIGATDAEVGHVRDFFFDDQAWTIRYLVVETGSWLLSRRVLLSPFSLMDADWMHKRLPVSITCEQVKNSPDIDTQQPVSRQHETQHSDYYGYPYYWGGAGIWGDGLDVPMLRSRDSNGSRSNDDATEKEREIPIHTSAFAPDAGDPHLRSCEAVIGYQIHASDGEIGHVQSMLVDEESWAIRYLVVETGNWWLGHQVLIAPDWLTKISWEDSTVSVGLTCQNIKDSPRFDSSATLNRQVEADLFRHYGRPVYWDRERQQQVPVPQ